MRKTQPVLKSVPMVTGQVSEELGITISKEFIIRKLKVKPLLVLHLTILILLQPLR